MRCHGRPLCAPTFWPHARRCLSARKILKPALCGSSRSERLAMWDRPNKPCRVCAPARIANALTLCREGGDGRERGRTMRRAARDRVADRGLAHRQTSIMEQIVGSFGPRDDAVFVSRPVFLHGPGGRRSCPGLTAKGGGTCPSMSQSPARPSLARHKALARPRAAAATPRPSENNRDIFAE